MLSEFYIMKKSKVMIITDYQWCTFTKILEVPEGPNPKHSFPLYDMVGLVGNVEQRFHVLFSMLCIGPTEMGGYWDLGIKNCLASRSIMTILSACFLPYL